jgi:transposase
MRGTTSRQSSMLCLKNPEELIARDHPLRAIKALADAALAAMSPFLDAMYAESGRASVPPEVLLKAKLLAALFSVRSDRQLCEQLRYNLMFRWFLDLDMLGEAFDHSTFSKNQARLLAHDTAGQFFATVVEHAKARGLMSEDHFSVDGTLIEAWASLKSFRPKGRDDGDSNGWASFKGEKRSNETHESKTDPEAKLARKGNGQEAKLAYSGHALMENRNGLLVDVRVLEANGKAEREAALAMIDDASRGNTPTTLGADKGYDTKSFVASCRERGVTPHVAKNEHSRRSSAIDRRTTRHPGYRASQLARRRIEQVFGWMKTFGGLRRTRWRGAARTQLAAYLVGAAYNLLRMARLVNTPP